jgi:hypothetical protein
MTITEFNETIKTGTEPVHLEKPLQSLWHDARGEWARAHDLAQADPGIDAARVHAYLHRKEGDESNALYWYTQAGSAAVNSSLEEEWDSLVSEFLKKT